MADAVTSITLLNTPKRLVMKFLNRSDGTGESNVVKVDKSTYTGTNGLEPSYFRIDKISYNVFGMEVLISIDNTSDQNLFRLQNGSDTLDFREFGGISTSGTGDTGDILFTTNGHTAADTYDITLYLEKIP